MMPRVAPRAPVADSLAASATPRDQITAALMRSFDAHQQLLPYFEAGIRDCEYGVGGFSSDSAL
jgi:hypothetical protein